MNSYGGLLPLSNEYTVRDTIRDTFCYSTLRAFDRNGNPFIVRVYKTGKLRPSEETLFKQEHEKLMNLGLKGVARIFFIGLYDGRPALVSEFHEPYFLSDYINTVKPGLQDFFKIAIPLTEILSGLHRNNIACLDLRPENIVCQEDSLKIVDFGSSLLITRKNEQLFNEEVIQDLLPYISPEQTGRMNRAADCRSDLYSLGIIFYELLTGRKPFSSADPMELIHSHLARRPVPPEELNMGIPPVLSRIVMQLLEKSPEERYLSADGLLADLANCADRLKSTGSIDEFTTGQYDVSYDIIIPGILVGRDREREILAAVFNSVIPQYNDRESNDDRMEVTFISGGAGCGKTALIDEVRKLAAVNRTYFLEARYQENKQNTPYSAIIDALNKMIMQILSENTDRISFWRKTILDAVGENGKLMTDILPALELLTGRQPSVTLLSVEASQYRLVYTFMNFIRAMASGAGGLVLVVEDIQWMDSASLNILKSMIINRDLIRVMLVMSYRTETKDDSSCVHEFPASLKEKGIIVTEISIGPLSCEDTKTYVNRIVALDEHDSHQAGDLIYQKTGGNPFYINQIIRSLYEADALHFQVDKGWRYDPLKINEARIPDTLIGLLAERIASLHAQEKNILRICSCLGTKFDIDTAAGIGELQVEAVFSAVRRGIDQGIILFYNKEYCFAHDKIHEAFYSEIPDDEKAVIHLKAGRVMLRNSAGNNDNDLTDIIAGHFMAGLSAVSSDAERETIAFLNVAASKKAISLAAYESALAYIKAAVSVTGSDCWEKNYDFALSLYTTAAEAAFLSGDLVFMEDMTSAALNKIKTFMDRIPFYELVIQARYAQNRMQEGLDEGVRVLGMLGVSVPSDPTRLDVMAALVKTRIFLGRKKYNDLLSMKEMRNPTIKAVMKISGTLGVNAYKIRPMIVPYITFKTIKLSVKYGNFPGTAYAFAAYGMILCGVLGKIDEGFKYGNLALQLSGRPEAVKYRPRTIHLVYCMIWHWKNHLRDTIDQIKHAYALGMEMGDIEDATSSAHLYCAYKYFCGDRLNDLIPEMSGYDHVVKRFRQETNLNYLKIERQAVINLVEQTGDPVMLEGAAYSESMMRPVHEQAGDKTAFAIVYIQKTILAFLFGRYEESVEHADNALLHIDGLLSLAFLPVFYFYDSLSRLAVYDISAPGKREKLLRKAGAGLKLLRKWSALAPMNHGHKCDLVQAELSRISGDHDGAMKLYDRAISGADANGYVQEAAVACECAARFYLARGNSRIASVYMNDARERYSEWGAVSKIADMNRRYSDLLSGIKKGVTEQTEHHGGVVEQYNELPSALNPVLDFNTVVDALQSISGEIVLERFIDHVMKLIIKNAGASRGVLLISRNDDLYAAAEGLAEGSTSVLKKPVPLSGYSGLPHSIINYTARSGEPVVLRSAAADNVFSSDTYVKTSGAKSVLCQPLVNQQQLKGIIYLENNLATDVFSKERMELVKLLSSQAAISLEKAILFERSLAAEREIQQQYEEMQAQYEEMEAMNEELHRAYTELDEINARLAGESRMLSIFRHMADSSVQGMSLADMSGRVIYMNSAMLSMFGLESGEDTAGRDILDFYPESERPRITGKIVPAVLEQGQWVEEVKIGNSRVGNAVTMQTVFLLRDKDGTPLSFATIVTDITSLKEAENTLRESEERYRILVETMNDGLCVVNTDKEFSYLNKSLCRMLGYSEKELLGRPIESLLDDGSRRLFRKEYSKRAGGSERIYELEWITKDNTRLSTIVSPKPVYDSGNRIVASLAVITDITDRKLAEMEKEAMQAQLLHSQKMEAIGTLAGGIAHDFNNMLTSIFGNTDLLLLGLSEDDPKFTIVQEIAGAAEKSASLTRQLLAFSRKQMIEPAALDLNSIILDMEKMLKRLIGEDIGLEVKLDPDIMIINADKSQIEQIILNLAVNARDAMPDGGKLTITTCNAVIDRKPEEAADAKTGTFVLLSIEDTGYGMDAELQKKIFEPFFTTKETNKGTGLGLAVVYGIVKQHEGWVHVESEPMKGSCFSIYLPGVKPDGTEIKSRVLSTSGPLVQCGSGERILLVEDQEDVRKFVRNALYSFGYNVIQAHDIKSAMELFEKEGADFDLLLSDVVLPDGKGFALADNLLARKPGLKIILSSGYTEQKFQYRLIQEKHYNFLPKPYTLNSLLEMVRRVIAAE